MKFKQIVFAVAAMASLVLSASAHSDVVVQTFVEPSTLNAWVANNIVFNQFDPSLGTLGSITVSLTGAGQMSTQVVVTADQFGTAEVDQITSGSRINVYNTGTAGSGTVIATGSASITLVDPSGPPVFIPAGTSQTFGPQTADIAINPTVVTSTSAFIGTGVVTLSMLGSRVSTLNVTDGTATPTTSSGGTLFLTYNYTPASVPEPGALVLGSLCCTAMVGVGVARRRSARKTLPTDAS